MITQFMLQVPKGKDVYILYAYTLYPQEKLVESPLPLLVQSVQHHIAVGKSVYDAVTLMSDFSNGKQSSDSSIAYWTVSLGS